MAYHQPYCAQCGRSLRHLPDTGRCPNCDAYYSPDDPVIFGRPDSEKLGIRPGRRAFICSMVFGILMILTFIVDIADQQYAGAIGQLFFALVLFFWYPIYQMKRKPANRTSSMQVRLFRDCYGSRRGFGKVRYLRWRTDMEIVLSHDEGRFYRLRMDRLMSDGAIDWSTSINIRFHASRVRVAFLRNYIEECRAAIAAAKR